MYQYVTKTKLSYMYGHPKTDGKKQTLLKLIFVITFLHVIYVGTYLTGHPKQPMPFEQTQM